MSPPTRFQIMRYSVFLVYLFNLQNSSFRFADGAVMTPPYILRFYSFGYYITPSRGRKVEIVNNFPVKSRKLSYTCEKGGDFLFFRLHPALLEGGLAAAPSMKGSRHFLAHGAQIALPGSKAEAVALGITAAEHSRPAAAHLRNGIRQLPGSRAVQTFLKMDYIARPRVSGGSLGKQPSVQTC